MVLFGHQRQVDGYIIDSNIKMSPKSHQGSLKNQPTKVRLQKTPVNNSHKTLSQTYPFLPSYHPILTNRFTQTATPSHLTQKGRRAGRPPTCGPSASTPPLLWEEAWGGRDGWHGRFSEEKYGWGVLGCFCLFLLFDVICFMVSLRLELCGFIGFRWFQFFFGQKTVE